MSFMFEVLYKPPSDSKREGLLTKSVSEFGGVVSFREDPDSPEAGAVCLTYEFDDLQMAEQAADLRSPFDPFTKLDGMKWPFAVHHRLIIYCVTSLQPGTLARLSRRRLSRLPVPRLRCGSGTRA